MNSDRIIVGDWTVDASCNQISNERGVVELEPRVMDLLMLFAARPGEVISKADIGGVLWSDVHVNDDAITRSIFKLRKALQDDAKRPMYIETVSKRGYRLIGEVSGVASAPKPTFSPSRMVFLAVTAALLFVGVTVAALLSAPGSQTAQVDPGRATALILRADGFYSQYTRSDNEAAARIYEAILEQDPEDPAALAGLSNTITQRVIRYQGPGSEGELGRRSVTEALESGWLDHPDAKVRLRNARLLARQATVLSPTHTRAWRALGLAQSGLQDFQAARRSYEQALIVGPDDWGTMINLSELSFLVGEEQDALSLLVQAWYSMDKSYADDQVAIRPWHSAVGLEIASAHVELANLLESKVWFERVLSRDPLNADATRGLAGVLKRLGEGERAEIICRDLATATTEVC